MSTDPLDLKPTPSRVWVLFKEKILPESAWESANDHAGFIPTPEDWRRFLDRMILTLGVIFLVAGIVFFFAFNWADLPRFGKFAVVQAATVLAAVLAFLLRLETWGGRLAMFAAAMFVGVTLAVTGQAYQTGADSYRLFLIWWLIILAMLALALLALAFVLGPLRQVSIGVRLAVGVLAGLSFKYLQDLFAPMSLVYDLPPWLAVLLPILLCYGVAVFAVRMNR